VSDKIVTRFAPSPTGYLHLGHAYSAWLNFERGDTFILRIEDIDATRCKPEFEAAIYEDLKWLGLNWEEPVRRQSDRLKIYEAKLKDLYERGLVYRCFKTRKDLHEIMNAPHVYGTPFHGSPDPDEAQKLAQDLPYAWRLKMDKAAQTTGETKAARHGDVVLGRKDIGTSYHLSCVMDDADQGITHVIRGQDLADIADLHTLLFKLLCHTPPHIEHHKLITDETGKRFAKRDQSVTLTALRESGMTPEDVRKRLFPEPSGA